MNVVVSQPMFFPWLGIFEQLRLADVFVHYDDVQMPMGRSFVSRVQIKTARGPQWLTAPVSRPGAHTLIRDVRLCNELGWRGKHLRTLETHYAAAPYWPEARTLAEQAYRYETASLAAFNIHAIELIARYFGIETEFRLSSDFPTDHRSTEHLLHLVKRFGGDTYITGHGAKHYLDHELLERHGIEICYIDYLRQPYPQLFGAFDPYVTILDVIANLGPAGRDLMCSGTVHWREFIRE